MLQISSHYALAQPLLCPQNVTIKLPLLKPYTHNFRLSSVLVELQHYNIALHACMVLMFTATNSTTGGKG